MQMNLPIPRAQSRLFVALLLLLCCTSALALDPRSALQAVDGSLDERSQALAAIARSALESGARPEEARPAPDERTRALRFLDDIESGALFVDGDRVLRREEAGSIQDATVAPMVDAVTGAAAHLSSERRASLQDVLVNNRVRRAVGAARAALHLGDADPATRIHAARTLAGEGSELWMPALDAQLRIEGDEGVRNELHRELHRIRASLGLASEDPAMRRSAIAAIAEHPSATARGLLDARLRRNGDAWVEPDESIRDEARLALARIDSSLAWSDRISVLFTGLSLGSILLLAALGLAITYGLMGVINMAHGELMMIGAYATWLVQDAFARWLPQYHEAWLIAAIPASFLVSAAMGAVLERTVIRWLYGRPLETLLATFGISLILMQLVRSLFGAQNVQVGNPAWLSGGIAITPALTLPWNRIGIVVFAALVVTGTVLLLKRTRLGLHLRAVTQNRRMAACVGVRTGRVDMTAFALGSGIAGLAGCALSQVGNVGPDLGQAWIVDSFMVVVLGGVGQVSGAVIAALGLGIANKLLEGMTGAVLAKITVLVMIILFIQKRPQGLFAMKGRTVEA